jgi:predicted transposase YbfD/YdcC
MTSTLEASIRIGARNSGIENSVHWILDIAFRKDESRIRKGSAPENISATLHIALNLLKTNKTFKGSIKTKRLNAAMDKKYLGEVVFG